VATALTPLADALAQILADVPAITDNEIVAVGEALGRVLAESLRACVDVPPWDNSAMDGYALRAGDLSTVPQTLAISQRIAAGQSGEALLPGTVARIFTGAPVPPGADAVIMQEETAASDNQLECLEPVVVGQNIRRRGEDILAGTEIAAAGHRLSAADLGVLASVGFASVTVVRRPRVAVISTGDELREPGESLEPGQIYNSNRYQLRGLLQALGVQCIDLGIVQDDAQATRVALRQAADEADLIITTGGVSVGEEDHVRSQVAALGELKLWKLAIKPGKPLAYGRVGQTPIIGLPGNPGAVFVTFNLVARPYLLRLCGVDQIETLQLNAIADFDWPKPGKRQEYLRVSLQAGEDGVNRVARYANQSSGVLSSAAWANALAVIPVGTTFNAGTVVKVLVLSDLLG
jgi:molybdopterin molybdotransferase